VGHVDSEVDTRLEAVGGDDALRLRGLAAISQAKLAYRLFRDQFSGPRWERLAALGAHRQRPLWASTSSNNPAYLDTLCSASPSRLGSRSNTGRSPRPFTATETAGPVTLETGRAVQRVSVGLWWTSSTSWTHRA
jgi:hypothetical protein